MYKASEINKVLKTLGVDSVRYTGDMFYAGKVHHSKTKGIKIGSMSPMDVFDNISSIKSDVQQKVVRALLPMSIQNEQFGGLYIFYIQTMKTKCRKLVFSFDTFPTHERSSNLDSGYQTVWYTVSFTDMKISDLDGAEPVKKKKPTSIKFEFIYTDITDKDGTDRIVEVDATTQKDAVILFWEKIEYQTNSDSYEILEINRI